MYRDSTSIKTGQRLVVSGNDHSDLDLPCLPISNPDFGEMCEVGDSLFVGRYLVNGADESSLYLEVSPWTRCVSGQAKVVHLACALWALDLAWHPGCILAGCCELPGAGGVEVWLDRAVLTCMRPQ